MTLPRFDMVDEVQFNLELAQHILQRAATKIPSDKSDTLSLDTLREIAQDSGISLQSLDEVISDIARDSELKQQDKRDFWIVSFQLFKVAIVISNLALFGFTSAAIITSDIVSVSSIIPGSQCHILNDPTCILLFTIARSSLYFFAQLLVKFSIISVFWSGSMIATEYLFLWGEKMVLYFQTHSRT